MARQPRDEEAGSSYHVTIHSVAEATIVRSDRDRKILVETLAETVRRFGWVCIAFCVLDTHYHLLVTTPERNLGLGMKYLNGTYAQAFNRRHGRRGHLFRDRYHSKRIKTEAHLLSTIRYIALNGYRAGTAPHPRADTWNSYPRAIGALTRWPFVATATLLSYFSPHKPNALRKLILFVEGRNLERERRRDAPF